MRQHLHTAAPPAAQIFPGCPWFLRTTGMMHRFSSQARTLQSGPTAQAPLSPLPMGTPPTHSTKAPAWWQSHLALQIGRLRLPRLVHIDDLHHVGVAKAFLLHLLSRPDVGQGDEGAFLNGSPTQGAEALEGKTGVTYQIQMAVGSFHCKDHWAWAVKQLHCL